MTNDINFVDEKGNLLPLEDLQNQLRDIYNQVLENQCENSVLDDLIAPDVQINSEEVINTFDFLDRTLYLTTEIESDHAIAFTEAIKFWNRIDEIDNIAVEERNPIKVYIDTPGGDLDATFSIIDAINLSKTPVWTITISSGNSGGFFIGINGDKRIGYPHSTYLFHEGSCGDSEDSHKYLQFADFYRKRLQMLKENVLEKTKFTENDYEKFKKDDLWLTAKDALEHGVIDEIATEII